MVALLGLVLSILNLVFKAFLIKTFWAWFIMTQFSGLPALTPISAIGISCFTGLFAHYRGLTLEEANRLVEKGDNGKIKYNHLSLINGAIYHFALWVCFGFAYIVHSLM